MKVTSVHILYRLSFLFQRSLGLTIALASYATTSDMPDVNAAIKARAGCRPDKIIKPTSICCLIFCVGKFVQHYSPGMANTSQAPRRTVNKHLLTPRSEYQEIFANSTNPKALIFSTNCFGKRCFVNISARFSEEATLCMTMIFERN